MRIIVKRSVKKIQASMHCCIMFVMENKTFMHKLCLSSCVE